MKPLFDVIDAGEGKIIKAWRNGVQFEDSAIEQLKNVARLPFVKGVAAMPDCHWGVGATVGSVIAAQGAISPAVVGVDIGCGMYAVKTDLIAANVASPEFRQVMFDRISNAVPHGRTNDGGAGDRGAWHNIPEDIGNSWWNHFAPYVQENLGINHPGAVSRNAERQLGTLGTGNHFIEVSLDVDNAVWVVLHSGSRGFGNRIGSYFTKLAKEECDKWFVNLPDPNLAYFPQDTMFYAEYLTALTCAQEFAFVNREIMMTRVLAAIGAARMEGIHCHHNYMQFEKHGGQTYIVTRKGAVRAQLGDKIVIPGSMGARTYLAEGLGSKDSFCSCSHGAGRAMGRKEAERTFTVEQHAEATAGVVCDKTAGTLDETPGAYKNIDAVMAAQADLCKPFNTLKQIVCVKGLSD